MGSYTKINQGRDPFSTRDRVTEDQQLVQLGQQNAQGQRPGPPQLQGQNQPPANRAEEWHTILGTMNKGYNQLDAPGQAKVNDLNTRTESILASKGQLRNDEFEAAMTSIHETAVDYPWEQHVKPPGSNPGDVVEEEGIMKLTEADGSRKPIAYTPEYMSKNAMPIAGTGKIAIPVAPDKPYVIVDAKERDVSAERGETDKAVKGIEKIYAEVAKGFQAEKEVLDDDGKVIGTLPFTREERRRMSIMAKDAYIKDQLQAKHAAKTITDAGAHELQQAIGGDVADPYQAEQNIVDQSREIMVHRQARKEAAGELMTEQGMDPNQLPPPTPTMTPTPPQKQTDPAAAGLDPALIQQIEAMSEGETPQERAAESSEYHAARAEISAVASGSNFEQRLVNAGSNVRPLAVSSKAEMNEKYAESPDGTTVKLPNGRRFVMDEGKFFEVPWSEKQLASDVMLDAEGREIIDPNTGKAAPGIIEQLEAGKSQTLSPSGIAHAAVTAPPVRRGEEPLRVPEEVAQQRMAQAAIPNRVAAQKIAVGPTAQPAAVDPELTAEASQGVDPGRLPQPEAHQPATATQEAIQARTHQFAAMQTMLDPNEMRRKLQDFSRSRGSETRKLLKPRQLKPGESVSDVEAGEAFISRSGHVWYKNKDGSLEGPFTQAQIQTEQGRRMSARAITADQRVPRSIGGRTF